MITNGWLISGLYYLNLFSLFLIFYNRYLSSITYHWNCARYWLFYSVISFSDSFFIFICLRNYSIKFTCLELLLFLPLGTNWKGLSLLIWLNSDLNFARVAWSLVFVYNSEETSCLIWSILVIQSCCLPYIDLIFKIKASFYYILSFIWFVI